MKRHVLASVFWPFALLLALSDAAIAQPQAATVAAMQVTKDDLQSRIAAVEGAMDLDPAVKTEAADRYRSALRELGRAEEAEKTAARFKAEAQAAAETAAARKTELESVYKSPSLPTFDGKDLAELDAERATRDAEAAVLKQRLVELDAEHARRAKRKVEIRSVQAEAEARRTQLVERVDAQPPANEPPVLTEARRIEARQSLHAFEQSLPMLEFELAKYVAEDSHQLLRHEENLVKAQLDQKEVAIRLLTDQINRRRQEDVVRHVREAEREKSFAHPLLKPLAEENVQDAERIGSLSRQIEGIELATQATRSKQEEQQAKFDQMREKESKLGLTRPIGLMLRAHRNDIPDLREFERQLETRQELIEQAHLLPWQHAETLANLKDAREYLRSTSEESAAAAEQGKFALSVEQQSYLEDAAADLLSSRRDLLVELEETSKRYIEALSERDDADRAYVQTCSDYLHYINERILWTRSADPLSIELVEADSGTWNWLLSPTHWRAVAVVLAADPIEHPFAFWPTLVAIVALFYVRSRIRPRLKALGLHAGKRGFLRYGPTAQAAVLTIMSAITAPTVLLFLSWRLDEAVEPTGFVRAVADALAGCAAALLPIELLRETCRHSGLAEAHFAWPPRAVGHLRRTLTWMKLLGVPATFLAVLAHYHEPLSGGTAAERLLFIAGMAIAAFVLFRLLSGRAELVKAFAIERPGGPFSRYHLLWCGLAVAVPIGFAGLSAFGYHYSATQAADRLLWTVWLAVGGVVLRAMAVRWIVLSRRRLLLDQAYQRRATEEAQDASDVPRPPAAVEETDVARTTAQTRKLVDIVIFGFAVTGIGMIWAETMPAIGLLDQPVWERSENAPVASGAAANATTTVSSSEAEAFAPADRAVTRFDVAIAAFTALFTFLASRNLPGLMEMSVLNRLPLDNATRYAATRLACYAIVIAGVLMASNHLGLRWQNVQWLAAALTVGLGFGLQEVFANFVSGLIILFERPIRVGDVVTIDAVTGVVSRIRMRATTITNWDRKEFIVPNKEFITGRVLNWTLSDAVNRVTINVGVAYGSDTSRVRDILLRVCDEEPEILKDPAPTASFEAFGDSTLNFVLRCFLPSLDQRSDVTHELHTRIDREFRKAGIEISFPQRDLHIRSIDGMTLPIATGQAARSGTVERAAG